MLNWISTSHDASIHGFPALADLNPGERAVVRATAASDLAIRTVAASLVAGAILPTVGSRAAIRRELDNAAFYSEIAGQHDVSASFPRPLDSPVVHRTAAGPTARALSGGTAEAATFHSGFEPRNRSLRRKWHSFERNNIAHFQHWRHPDGPRPTLCVIHGFFASTYLFNSVFLQLPWFYKAGYDVVLYTLPFHGARAERWSPYSGHGYFAHGAGGFVEATGQAVHDFRKLVDHLESTGVTRIGVTGISLGGMTSALLATVEDRLEFAVPNVPVVEVSKLLSAWFPAAQLVRSGLQRGGTDESTFNDVFAYTSPLNYSPLIPKDRRLIITGLGDRLAPPEQSAALWEHWDRCALHWFPGNHLMHVSQADYLHRMIGFLKDIDFVPDAWRGLAS